MDKGWLKKVCRAVVQRLARLLLLCLVGYCASGCRQAERLACVDPLGCIDLDPAEPMRLGYLLALTGPARALGVDARRGIEIAIAEQGEQLLGHPLDLIGEDSECDPEAVLSAATKITLAPNILGVIGPACPESQAEALLAFNNSGMTAITLGAATPANSPAASRLAFSERAQGQGAAAFAYTQLGARRAALLNDGSAYSQALQRAFTDKFIALGGAITASASLPPDTVDAHPYLSSLVKDPPEVLYFPVFGPLGFLLNQQAAEYTALAATAQLAADAQLTDQFLRSASVPPAGLFLSGPDLRNIDTPARLEQWTAAYGTAPTSSWHALAYDAAILLFDAIERSAQRAPDGSLLIGRQALRAAIPTTPAFGGLSGSVACSRQGECLVSDPIAIYLVGGPGSELNWPPPLVWRAGSP
jgi:branched-chain amino acid transport system substrate-binding protein